MSTYQARFSNETEMAIQKSEESRIAYKFNMEKCENLVEEANILFGELDDIKAQCWEIVENMSSKEPLFMPIEHQQKRQMNLKPQEVENKSLIDDATIDSSGEWIEEASIGIQTSFATFVEDCTVESTPNNSTHIAIDKISTPDRQAPKDLQENATSESANNTKLIETASEKETLSTPLDQKENSVLEDFQKCSPSENSTPNKTVTIALKNTQNLEQESYEKSKQSFAIQTSFTDDISLNSTKTSQANNTYSVFTPKPMMKSFTAQTSFIDKSLLEPENKTEIVDDEQPSTNEATLANREDLANTSENNSSENNENNSSENNNSENNENNSIEQEQHNNTVVITTINNIENNVDGISIENNFNENYTTKDNVDKNSNANNIDESKVASTNITVASLTGNIADLNSTNNVDNKVDFANSTVADKSLDNKTNAEDKSRTLNITCLTEQDSMYLENFMNHNDSGFTLDQAKKAQTSYLQQKEEKKHMNPNQTGLYYSFIKQKGQRASRLTRSASKLLNASQLNKSSTLENSRILSATYLTVDDSMYLENFMNPNDTVFTYERAKEAQQAYFEKDESLYFNPNQTGVQYSFNSKKRLKDNEKKNSNSVEIDGQKKSTEDEEHRKEQFEEFEESIEFMSPNCSPSSRNHLQRTANTTKLQEVNSSATPVHFDIKNKSCVSEKSIYEVAAPIDNATSNISELKTADSNGDDHMHVDLSKKHYKMNEISRTSNKQKSENDVKNSIILHPGDSVAVKRKRRSSPAEPDVSQNIPSEAEIEVAEMHEHDRSNATIKPEHSIMRITRSRNQQSINETQTALNSSKQSRRSNQLLKETDICPKNENHANTLMRTPSEIFMEISTAVQLKSENPMDEFVNNDSKVILKTEQPTTTGKNKTNIPSDTSGSRVNKKRRKRRLRITMPKNFKMFPDENCKTSNRKPVVKKANNRKLENIPEEKEENTEIMVVHVDVENNVMQQSVSQNNNTSLEKRGKGKAANKTQNRSTSSNKNLSLGQESVSKTPGGEQQNKSIECSSCTTPIATPMTTAMRDILCKDCLCNVKQSRASKTLLRTVLMDQTDKSLLTSQKTVPKKKKSTTKKKNDYAETTTNNETKQEETAKNNETHFKNENFPVTSKRAQPKRATRSSTRSCVTNNNDITYTSTVIRQKGGGRGKKSTEEPPVLQSKNESQKKDSVQSTEKGPTKKPVSKSRQKKGLVQTTEEEEQAKSMNDSHNKKPASKAKKEPKKRNQKKTKQVESKNDRGDKSVLKNTNASKFVEQSVEKSVAYVNENHIECANNEEDKENNVTLSFVNDDLITSNQIATKETRKPSTTQVLQPRVENCLQESQQNVAAATKEVFAVPTVPPVKRARKPRQKMWMPQKKKTRKQSEAPNKSTTPKQKLTKNNKRGERSTPNASIPQLKVNKSKRNRRVSFADVKLRNKDKSKNTPTSSSNNGKNVERTPITAKRIRVSPRKDTSSIDPTTLFDNSDMQIPKPFNKPQPNQHLNVLVEKPPAPPASSTRKRSVRTNDTLADVTVSSVDLTRGVGETTASYLVRKKKKLLDTKNNRLATPEGDQLNSTRISGKHTLRRLAPDISVIPKGPVANSNRRVPEAILSFVEGMKKTRK